MTEKSLIVVEKLDAVALYAEGGMGVILDEIKAKVDAFVPDVSTEESRKEITSFAYKIARSKTLLDDLGKEIVADKKKEVKKVDAVRKEARDFCDNLKAGVRKPLDEWEAEEAKRKEEEETKEREKIQARIDALAIYGANLPYLDVAAMPDEEFDTTLLLAKGEFEAEEERKAQEEADRKAESERLEKERAELDRQKEEQEAEKKRLAEIQEKIELEQKTQREKFEAEQAAIQKEIDEKRAAFEAEKQRIKDEESKKAYEKQVKEEAERAAKKKIADDEQKRIERERAEAAEKARIETLKPDKEKVLNWIEVELKRDLNFPKVEIQEIQDLLYGLGVAIGDLLVNYKKKVEDL